MRAMTRGAARRVQFRPRRDSRRLSSKWIPLLRARRWRVMKICILRHNRPHKDARNSENECE